MGGGGNRHSKMCVVGLVSLHTGNPDGQRLDLGEIGARREIGIWGGYGLDGGRCGQSRGATGTPTHAGTGWCSGACISAAGLGMRRLSLQWVRGLVLGLTTAPEKGELGLFLSKN